MVKSLKVSILGKYSTKYLRMIPKANQKVKYFIMSILQLKHFAGLNQSRKKFIVNVLCQILCIKGKLNFLQLERYGNYSEQTYRNQYEQKFDFFAFNKKLIDQVVSCERIIAFDPSYIPKAGKCTYGKGKYWSGVAGTAKWGLEIGGFAVVDVKNNSAFHLQAYQTPSSVQLKTDGLTLLSHYGQLVSQHSKEFKAIANYLVVDAYFSKAPFVVAAVTSGMHLISRLRDDSVLFYKFKGSPTGKKGRPKSFNGRVDTKKVDMDCFKTIHSCPELEVYSAIVYSKAFKMDINLAITVFKKEGKEINRKLYFSTNLQQAGDEIVRYYRSRFQIEFLYRDAKQHTGLTNVQARSENKLDFHFNASLTAINLAKQEWIQGKSEHEKTFSMADYKTLFNNILMLDLFIRRFAINPNTAKNQKIVQELLGYGKIAA